MHRLVKVSLALGWAGTLFSVGCSSPMDGDAGDASDASQQIETSTDTGTEGGIVPDGSPDAALCPRIDFVTPAQDAILGGPADLDMNCSNGLQVDVQVATAAPIGTQLELFANRTRVAGPVTVQGPSLVFSRVDLGSQGAVDLAVRRVGDTTLCAIRRVQVDCGTPTCEIVTPAMDGLNRSNNVSSDPSRFATRVVVQTNVEDGQSVALNVSSLTQPLTVSAAGGMGIFTSVPLVPDGEHILRASCTNRAGTVGRSLVRTVTVDNVLPTLTVNQPAPNTTIAFGAPDTDPTTPGKQFQVCARSDAQGRMMAGRIAGQTAMSSATITSATADTCFNLTCPTGPAAFDVEVEVSDAAGNRASSTIRGISCASSNPSVRIIDPVASVLGMPATYLNQSRDANPTMTDLQYTILGCTDVAAGNAQLYVNGAAVGAPVAVAGGEPRCTAAGLMSAARFPNVTLVQSLPPRRVSADPLPSGPTLEIRVTNAAMDTGSSGQVTVFVDTVAPQLGFTLPACGSVLRPGPGGNAQTNVVVRADTSPVTLTLRRGTDTPMMLTGNFATPTATQIDFGLTTFAPGTWTLSAAATDPAGNAGSTTGTCTVDVGDPPVLRFTSPVTSQRFSSNGDTNPGMPGFQSVNVVLTTDAPDGTPVSLVVGGQPAVTANATGGSVTFSNVSLPEGAAVALDASATVSGRGTGTASISVVVDTAPPSALTGLTANVTGRRAGQVTLRWTGASDPNPAGGTRAVRTYQIRYATTAITDEASFSAGQTAAFAGTPGAPGTMETAVVSGLRVGVPFFFAVRAEDDGGNVGPILGTTAPGVTLDLVRDTFLESTVRPNGSVSGGFDVNGDSIADAVVGTATAVARVYFGQRNTGITATNYVTLTFAGDSSFGSAVKLLQDFDGDGLGDIAVTAPASGVGTGRVFIFLGRRNWPAAGGVISTPDISIVGPNAGDPEAADFATAQIGLGVAAADFNGDGLTDVVVGAPNANRAGTAGVGAVFVVRGRSSAAGTVVTLPGGADVRINGNMVASGRFGGAVAYGGALTNSDLMDEILVGANDQPNAVGSAYVFQGRVFGGSQIVLNASDRAFAHTGLVNTTQTRLPGALGDINGDGFNDFGVGSALSSGLYLYFGNSSGSFTYGNVVNQIAASDNFSQGFAKLFDRRLTRPSMLQPNAANPDVIIGSSQWNTADPRVAFFLSRTTAAWTTTSAANPDLTLVFTRAAGTGLSAHVPEWAGDLDGDGFVDLLVGQGVERSFTWVH